MSEKYSRREQPGSKKQPGKKIIILDTSALLAKYHLILPAINTEILTTPSVVEEVRDIENREALQLGLELSRIKPVEPSPKAREKTYTEAKKHRLHGKLSSTDLDVAALALQLKQEGFDTLVITDDYALQKLLYSMGVSFKPLRTRGIREVGRKPPGSHG